MIRFACLYSASGRFFPNQRSRSGAPERLLLAVVLSSFFFLLQDVFAADPPATCDPQIVAALAAGAAKHQMSCEYMVSRAYHDSLFMARIAPVAMLFIPCRNGYSHRPDEFASPEAIAHGALILAEALAELAA